MLRINKKLDEKDCIIFEILDLLSKRWNTFILLELGKYSNEKIRFSQLKSSLSQISSRALSMRLKELEEWKIIKKEEITNKKTKSTYYQLTKKGKELLPLLILLRDWAKTVKNCKIEKDCNKCDFISKCPINKIKDLKRKKE